MIRFQSIVALLLSIHREANAVDYSVAWLALLVGVFVVIVFVE